MNHVEYLFLLSRAHLLREEEAKAEKDGEEFHTSVTLTPLRNGLLAQARIMPDASGTMSLVLRLRGGAGTAQERIEASARAFYSASYFKQAEHLGGDWIEHVYVSHTIPSPLIKTRRDTS